MQNQSLVESRLWLQGQQPSSTGYIYFGWGCDMNIIMTLHDPGLE